MKRSLAMIAVVALATGSYLFSAATDAVKTDSGLLAGSLANGVYSYKGVPFAAPPVGNLRWSAPQPVVAWQGTRQATAPSAQCMQAPYPAGSVYAQADAPKGEDCLYLNVWTTSAPGANDRRPVMVWIHGGAWTRGAGDIDTYDGAQLSKRGVVVVTVNYRLGVFGFMAHPELTRESPNHSSGNYAFLDQIAALKWVQKNIAAFGGNAANVTIFGESAGSWSVNVLQASPLANGLFHRAIGESGGQFGRLSYLSTERDGQPAAESGGVALAKAVGATTLAELRAVPADKLLAAPGFRTVANVDGWVLPDTVKNIFAAHKQNDVPILVGSNANEMTTVTPAASIPRTLEDYRRRVSGTYGDMLAEYDAAYPVKTEADIREALLGSGRDTTFTMQMRTWARMNRSKVFLYSFSHVPPRPEAREYGAYHASEIGYVFNNIAKSGWQQESDKRIADAMASYWVNFATSGDPNSRTASSNKNLPVWTAYDTNTEPYMEFADAPQLRNHLLKVQVDFIEKFENRPRTTAR